MKSTFGARIAVFILLIIAVLIYSCQDDEGIYPGKVDPGTVATSNLIAYFPFDREPAGGAAVAYSNNQIKFVRKIGEGSFVPGRRGNAYQGSTDQSCLEFDVVQNSVFSTLDEFTLACWLKIPVTTPGIAKIFGLDGGDSLMGNLALLRDSHNGGDTLDLRFFMFDNYSTEFRAWEISARIDSLKDSWFHLVALYRKSTSTMELFANGVKVFSRESYSGTVPETGVQTPSGEISFGRHISKIFFGAWPQQLAGMSESWMAYYQGLIDEFRIYNKALSDEEVLFLFEAELSQIDE